jgi:nucleotide-binding universal stress UspA family protein
MFKRLLVPLDETPRDEEALAVARGLARRSGATVIVMHVQAPITDLPLVAETSRYLERRVKELRADGIEARYFVEYGQPPHEIGEAAEQEQPDLIVMAPHHRVWLDALRHPSVTVSMLSQASAPVLVWPDDASAHDVLSSLAVPGAGVLMPLDGSELAEHAIPFATRLAHEFDRPLLLLRVVTPVTLAGGGPATARLEMETQGNELREARTYLGVMRKRLARDTGLNVQSMVLRGSPTQELLRIAGSHTGSIMVLSTHGRNGFVRVVLGSVAADLVRESPIPVFVISPRAWHEEDFAIAATTAPEEPPQARG